MPANQSLAGSKANESVEGAGEEVKAEAEDAPAVVDPNADKLEIASTYVDPMSVANFSELVEFLVYVNNYKRNDQKMVLLMGDCAIQAGESFLVDICVSEGTMVDRRDGGRGLLEYQGI